MTEAAVMPRRSWPSCNQRKPGQRTVATDRGSNHKFNAGTGLLTERLLSNLSASLGERRSASILILGARAVCKQRDRRSRFAAGKSGTEGTRRVESVSAKALEEWSRTKQRASATGERRSGPRMLVRGGAPQIPRNVTSLDNRRRIAMF